MPEKGNIITREGQEDQGSQVRQQQSVAEAVPLLLHSLPGVTQAVMWVEEIYGKGQGCGAGSVLLKVS